MKVFPKRWKLRIPVGILVVLVGLIVILAIIVQLRWDRTFDHPAADITVPSDAATIARGEYLYKTVSVCGACHSAGGEENPDLLPTGGREFEIPELGTIYTPNITPAMETGIGSWTDGEVVRAIREGIGIDNRFLMLMPAEQFQGISDVDAQAIVAYLRSLEPVENETADFKPSIMGRVLLAFAIKPPDPITETVVSPPPGPTAEYGDYLANHVSPCAACHTPHVRGEIQEDKLWSGGFGFEVGDDMIYSANLTRDVETGIGSWDEDDFFTAIRTGVNPDGVVALLPMPWPQLKNMADDDLRAIWLSIQGVPAIHNVVPENEIN